MTREEIEELKGLAASMGLYDDKNPCKRAVILGKAIKSLEQEPCEDAVSRQYLIDIATKDGAYDYVSAQEIANAPSVNPRPKTGHWIKTSSGFKCSKCLIVHSHPSIFCPSCGARMIEPQGI